LRLRELSLSGLFQQVARPIRHAYRPRGTELRRFGLRARQTAVNENTDGDAEPCHDAVADPEDPARNLNLLGEAHIRPDCGGREQRPPPADDRTEQQAADYEGWKNDAALIGSAKW
jgi:hypothetical protein